MCIFHSLSANWRFNLIARHCENHKEDIKHEITFEKRESKDKSPPASLFLLLLKDEELIMMMNNELKSSDERYGNFKQWFVGFPLLIDDSGGKIDRQRLATALLFNLIFLI